MRRPTMPRAVSPTLSLLAVSAALAAGGAAAALVGPPSPTTDPVGTAAGRPLVPVSRNGAVCPEPFDAAGAQTRVGLAAPGLGGAETSPGEARLAPLPRPGAPLATLAAPSDAAAAMIEAAPRAPALVGEATAGLAPGFAAAMTTRTTTGDLRGLAGTACVQAGTDFWFVGSGAEVGQRGRLYLTNPESAPALVDVTLYGPAGEIDAPAGRGVSVAARGQEVLLLDALAPATARFGVHVQVRQGRVAAALRDQQIRGLDPLGIDWVPTAVAPARRVALPGVPAGAGERRLQVLAPGETDAIVRVRLLAADGSFVPASLDVIEVPAGSVAEVDLSPHARGEDVAVQLRADAPITAGLLARVGTAGEQAELAYTAAAPPLTRERPGAVALAAIGGGVRGQLMIAAPDGDATVRISPLRPAGGTPMTVTVTSGSQRTVDLTEISEATPFAVTVVPDQGSGPVFASRTLSEADQRGPLLTAMPVLPGRYLVRVPSVTGDLSTGLRGGS